MSITDDVIELKGLNSEIKELSKTLKTLRSYRKKCEDRILEYCETNQQPGLRYQDMVLVVETKERKKRSKKDERVSALGQLLESYGLPTSTQMIHEIMSATGSRKEMERRLRLMDDK